MKNWIRLRALCAAVSLVFAEPPPAVAQVKTTTIAGRVILPDGAAAENARVAVYAVRDGSGTRVPAGTGSSAYDGRYEVRGLPPGTYVVGVTPAPGDTPNPRGVSRPLPGETFYPDVTDAARAQRLTAIEGVPLEGIDVWLAPAPQRYTVGGRLFLPEGAAPRETVIEYGGQDVIRRGLWYVHDPGGLFEIEGVAQGPLVMLARAETDQGLLMGIASTVISVESVQDVRIVMRRPGRIVGHVRFERDITGGTSNIRVVPMQTLLRLSSLYPVPEAAIAQDGAFRLSDALGTFAFEVQGLPEGWTVKRVNRAGQRAPADRIVVGADETVTGVEILVGPRAK